MTILTIENRCKVASAVTGKEHVAQYAPAILKHEIVPWVDGTYEWDDIWNPDAEAWQWRMMVEWISGCLVPPINDGDQPYTSMKLYELAQAISDGDLATLEEMVFDLMGAKK